MIKKIRNKILLYGTKEKIVKILFTSFEIIVSLIFMLDLIFQSAKINKIFWVFTPIILIVLSIFTVTWIKPGVNLDNNESETINRSLGDTTLCALVVYIFAFGVIMYLDEHKNITSSIYATIAFFIITVVVDILVKTLISSAQNDNFKLIKKNNTGK